MSYVDGFVIPVAPDQKEAYRAVAAEAAPLFKKLGAVAIVECFEDDVPDGEVTDFRRAVGAEPGEEIVFSWIVYPSKEVRDEANRKMTEDPGMQSSAEMPFDMQRMIFGGFEPIVTLGSSDVEAPAAAERGAG